MSNSSLERDSTVPVICGISNMTQNKHFAESAINHNMFNTGTYSYPFVEASTIWAHSLLWHGQNKMHDILCIH